MMQNMAKDFKRMITLPDAVSIVAGSMIGCGIFIVSADISRQVNSGLLLIATWLIAGFITLCGGLSICELAGNIPEEGGQYVFLKKIFSEKIAFLYGWTLFLVIQTGTIAAVCVAFSKFFGILFPTVSTSNILFGLGNWHFTTQQLFAIFTVIFLTFINSRGIKYGVLTQNIFTITKVLSLASIVIIGLLFGFKLDVFTTNLLMPFELSLGTIKLLAVAIVGALFGSITWNNITFVAGEVKDPKRNIPRALVYGVMLVVSLYLLMNLIYIGVLPLDAIKTAPEDIVAARTIGEIFGDIGKYIIALVIMISAFGCANGMILTGSRVYYKMAKDRAFFRPLALINRKTKVPVNSLWAQCAWICTLILWGNYSQLLDFVIYASLLFYILVTAGVFVFRKKFPETNFRIPTFFPVTFLIFATYIVICLSIFKPMYTLPGLVITLLGIPVFHFWKKNNNKNKSR